MLTTQKQVRQAFWQAVADGMFGKLNVTRKRIPNYSGNGTMYNTDTRFAFIDWVDFMNKDGLIAEGLADRVTL